MSISLLEYRIRHPLIDSIFQSGIEESPGQYFYHGDIEKYDDMVLFENPNRVEFKLVLNQINHVQYIWMMQRIFDCFKDHFDRHYIRRAWPGSVRIPSHTFDNIRHWELRLSGEDELICKFEIKHSWIRSFIDENEYAYNFKQLETIIADYERNQPYADHASIWIYPNKWGDDWGIESNGGCP